jgi:hypothetical protein
MGDTLTHLGNVTDVENLLERVANALHVGGVFVPTFRDYVSAPLTAECRFIPLRNAYWPAFWNTQTTS